MNDFIHLPPYKNYLSRWINLAHVKNINKMGDEQIMIIYSSNEKEVFSGIWARVILDYLGEPEFQKAIFNHRYFDEV